MKKNKIIIVISILIILVLSFGFFYLKYYSNKPKTSLTEPLQNQKKSATTTQNTQAQPNTKKTAPILENNTQNEIFLVSNIENNLNKKVIDINLVKDSILIIEENPDNESLFEPWISFMQTNSLTLVKISKEGNEKLTKGVYIILDWYIYLSGNFENLDASKREEISAQYLEIKSLIK